MFSVNSVNILSENRTHTSYTSVFPLQPCMSQVRQRGNDHPELFHTMRYHDKKSSYLGYICNHLCRVPPSNNRFVERQAKAEFYSLMFLQTCALGKCISLSIICCTTLASCTIKRTSYHMAIGGLTIVNKCTMG